MTDMTEDPKGSPATIPDSCTPAEGNSEGPQGHINGDGEIDDYRHRLKELSKEKESFENENLRLVNRLASATDNKVALQREVAKLQQEQKTNQALWDEDKKQLEQAQDKITLLQEEAAEMQALATKYKEAFDLQTADFSKSYGELKQKSENYDQEVERLLNRNNNQANLLKQLEKQCHDIKVSAEAEINQLKTQLQDERQEVARLSENKTESNVGGFSLFGRPLHRSQSASPGELAHKTQASLARPQSASPSTSTHQNQVPVASPPPKIPKSSPKIEKKFMAQSPVPVPNAKKSPTAESKLGRDAWKNQDPVNDAAHIPVGMQASFLEDALQKKEKPHSKTLWGSLFGGGKEENEQAHETPSEPTGREESKELADQVQMAVKENELLQAERERKAKEQAEKQKEPDPNALQRSPSAKWGIMKIFNASEEDDEEPAAEEPKTRNSVGSAQAKNGDDDDDIDIDTLRQLAASRTAGLDEDELNKRLSVSNLEDASQDDQSFSSGERSSDEDSDPENPEDAMEDESDTPHDNNGIQDGETT